MTNIGYLHAVILTIGLFCKGSYCNWFHWAIITVKISRRSLLRQAITLLYQNHDSKILRIWFFFVEYLQVVVGLEYYTIFLCLKMKTMQTGVCMQLVVSHHYTLEYETILKPPIRFLFYGWNMWLKLIGPKYHASIIALFYSAVGRRIKIET